MRLRAVIAHEHAELSRAMIAKYFNEASGRFIEALTAELSHLSSEDVFWRFHFLLGAQYFTLANPGRIQALSDGRCDPADAEQAIAELVAFAAAGFRAPSRNRTTSRPAPLLEAS
jgi:hypothetical protein